MDMNYYEILGLPQDASKDDINKAYRTLIIKYHPDVRGESGKTFTEYLNVIHDTLLDDDRRQAYDESLLHGNPPQREANRPRTHGYTDDTDDDQVNLDEPPTTTPQRHREPASDEQSSPARQGVSLSPRDVNAPWSIRFLMATFIMYWCYPLFSHVIGMRINMLIPDNPITSLIPSSPFIIPALELLCMIGLGYVLLHTVHSRFMHLVVLALGSAATIAIMGIVPYYAPKHLYAIIWILMPLFVIGYDVVRVMEAKRYEQMRRTAMAEQRHFYMIQSLRLNDNRDAYVALLADERNMHTQKTIWGRAKLGDYVILGSGDEIEQRLGYRYSTHWSDIISRHFTSSIFTGGNAFRQ